MTLTTFRMNTYTKTGEGVANVATIHLTERAAKQIRALLEKDGVTKVTVPIYRDSKMGVMTLRSEADIAAHKAQVK